MRTCFFEDLKEKSTIPSTTWTLKMRVNSTRCKADCEETATKNKAKAMRKTVRNAQFIFFVNKS